MSRLALAAVLLALLARPVRAIEVRSPPGALHGFPSMSDPHGPVVADGELSQERRGDRLVVRARWSFRDGRRAEEQDAFRTGRELVRGAVQARSSGRR